METHDKSKTAKEFTLHWDAFISSGIPIVTRDRPFDVPQTFFQATAVTLIYGDKDAVLVDCLMTFKQTKELADWITSKDKNLTTIYISRTHTRLGTVEARTRARPVAIYVLRKSMLRLVHYQSANLS
jgi:hypothetical protein